VKIIRNAIGERVAVNNFGIRIGKVNSNGDFIDRFGRKKGIYMCGTIYKTDRKGNIKSLKSQKMFF